MEGMNPELDMFSVLTTQTNIESTCHNRAFPETTMSGNNPIEFLIITGNDQIIDLEQIMLYTKSRIMNHDNTVVTEKIGSGGGTANTKRHVWPINYFHATRFKNIEIYVNNTLVCHSDNMHSYRAMLECMLTFGGEPKKGQMKMALYSKDTNFTHTNYNGIVNSEEDENAGAKERYEASKFSKTFESFGRLHTDLTLQGRPLPPKTELRIKLYRADPKFCLQAANPGNDGYSILIDEAVLFYQVKTVAAGILVAHARTLQNNHYKYPLRKVKMRFFTHASGQQDVSVHNLCTGQLPRRIIMTMVGNTAFHGSYDTNPFLFHHFNCESLVMRVSNSPRPYEVLKMNYTDSHCLQGMYSLLTANGILNTDRDIGITPEDFMNGHTIYGFDLTADHNSQTPVFYLVNDGTVSLECRLSEASSESITMICYLEFDSVMNIDKDGHLFYNQ
jgi:hypothetical protein